MKFTIRDLFLVTVIVALMAGWAVDHWRPSNYRRQLELENAGMHHALESLGFKVERDGWRVKVYRDDNPKKNDYETEFDNPNSSISAPNPAKP
jgi:hypothetical protein